MAKASRPTTDIGESYMAGVEPPLDAQYLSRNTGQGRHFAEQWKRALDVDPKPVMVTQWNESVAQRQVATASNHPNFLGRPTSAGDPYFVDLFNQEFNRDIEPMAGGHGDNHYYLMADRIRRFKGMDAPLPTPGAVAIAIDGAFQDWAKAGPVYRDPRGDIVHRDYPRFDGHARYTNATGRDDILEARAAVDAGIVAFYAKTADAITSRADKQWMQLFIDADRNPATGWSGFDFAVNVDQDHTGIRTALCRWTGAAWQKAADVEYPSAGNEIEIAVPRSLLGLAGASADFQFQWADNAAAGGDIAVFSVNGDVAPDRRFRYAFSSRVSSPILIPGSALPGAGRLAWRLGSQSGSLGLPASAAGVGKDVRVDLIDSGGRVAWSKQLGSRETAPVEAGPSISGSAGAPLRGWYWLRAHCGEASATSRGILLMDGAVGEIRLANHLPQRYQREEK